ncbi:SAM-dependent methyltransferase [Tamlana crocina]|uniref:SAM-dependent methyltransferase n=1 Tax=Tamlana crocina TaxID=393006 RepID=A0ABX1DBL8_9FLAO|nr:SAM-dependent methyltransferase [Tamlana crocina]NJX14601.1 SAM-dependent methyltransferase [Tamlana crocina]
MTKTIGQLYLIPTTLGDNDPMEVLPASVKHIVENTDTFIVENEKTARRFIKRICPEKPQPSLNIFLLNKFTEATEVPSFLNPCLQGTDVGLLSEAGCPGVADPGADVVKIAHDKNIKVVPLVGPSSILMAMMGSGMNGQRFAFNGYLPIDKNERKKEIKRLERLSFEHNQSQIFIETPYRNNKMLEGLISVLDANTSVCVACDITLPSEFIKTQTAKQWKKNMVDLHKRPTIFIIHKF